jgi:diguanylate cyclase (GGDEF)-like protein
MPDSLSSQRLLEIIHTQNEIAATTLDSEAVMELVVLRARLLTQAEAAVVELAEGQEMVYHTVAGTAAPYGGLRLDINSSLSGLCVRLGQTLNCVDSRQDPRVNAEATERVGARSMVCVPLQHQGTTIGALKVYDSRPNAFSPSDVTTLDLLSSMIASHISHAGAFAEQRHDSRHDPLTGLLNRRALGERLVDELSRIARHGGSFSVCLLDLDRFKSVNDTYGHAIGDEVLGKVAHHLTGIRSEDSAYRLGGDEFAVVLIDPLVSGATAAMTRLAQTIDADPGCRGVGLSWGIADALAADAPEAVLARADLSLYEAKRRLMTASESLSSA